VGTLESELRRGWRSARPFLDATLERMRGMSAGEWVGVAVCALLAWLLVPLLLVLLGIVLFVAALVAWVAEFVTLMRLREDVFPGRRDKLVWMLLMILVPPVGLLAFWTFRRSHWPDGVPVDSPSTEKSRSPWSEDEFG
jgi:hypothetical protein